MSKKLSLSNLSAEPAPNPTFRRQGVDREQATKLARENFAWLTVVVANTCESVSGFLSRDAALLKDTNLNLGLSNGTMMFESSLSYDTFFHRVMQCLQLPTTTTAKIKVWLPWRLECRTLRKGDFWTWRNWYLSGADSARSDNPHIDVNTLYVSVDYQQVLRYICVIENYIYESIFSLKLSRKQKNHDKRRWKKQKLMHEV